MENNLFKTVLVPDWDNVPVGTKFKAKIEGVECEGRIQKEDGNIYLCQNEKDGKGCGDSLGFYYSWNIGYGSPVDLKDTEVEIISFELDSSFKALPVIEVEDDKIFTSVEVHDWWKIPVGTKFIAKIDGVLCEGKIQIDEEGVHLCQDVIKGGHRPKDTLGYKYGWNVAGYSIIGALGEARTEIIYLDLNSYYSKLLNSI